MAMECGGLRPNQDVTQFWAVVGLLNLGDDMEVIVLLLLHDVSETDQCTIRSLSVPEKASSLST